ncbi:MAG: RNA methyltransferase [Acidobacteriota bacterium]|nr:RNA methyltransferase [Acidobacteriota bacterium]
MTTRIDAPSNPRIAAAVKAASSGTSMLLEGRRMIEDALDAGIRIEELFVQRDSGEEEKDREKEEDFLRRVRGGGDTRAKEPAPRVTEVSARVLRKLSELPSTRGVVALASPPHRTLASLSSLLPSKKSSSFSSPLFLILDDIQDPANVGAILRSGEAFGVSAALLTPGCASPFSPRALRASAGSAFRIPIAARVAAREAVLWAQANGIALAGAEAHTGAAPEELSGVRPLALVIGSEGHGISPELAAALDHRVTVPLLGRVESLNAAVAAGVLLHILTRRRASPG